MSAPSPRSLPRGTRGRLAGVLALVVLVVSVLAVVAAFQIHAGRDRTALGSVGWVAEQLRTRDWTDTIVVVAGLVCVVAGLALVLVGLVPARRSMLRLADPDEHTIAGISRAGLDRDLTAVVAAVDGVASAKAVVRGDRVRVQASSALRGDAGLHESVESAVVGRLETLRLDRRLQVQVRVRPGGD